ncbi:MAG: hypothetical protein A2V59_08235 [Armatimonadetes bacterium RBG_19FT_COMBO_69_19]|nr:MAG: hypothetical protein A2V59_08235 [Armatimonadetes bacterium RBG_19FT_COMBO_69_19]
MRGWISTVVTAAMVVLTLSGTATGQAGWSTFTHPALGFSLAYPDGWEVSGEDGSIAFMVMGPRPAGVADLRLNVNVTTDRVPADMTVEQFEAVSESRMGLLFNGYKRLRTDRTVISGRQAILRYYTWKRNDGLELYQMQLYLVASARGYVITGTTATRSGQLQREVGLLQQIIQTFRP